LEINFLGLQNNTYWRDLNGNKTIDNGEVDTWSSDFTNDLSYENDRTSFVDLTPAYYGGLSNSFSYNNFNLSFLFSFTKKQVTSFLGSVSEGLGKVNIPQSIYDARWQKPGDITDVAKFNPSDFYGPGNFANSTGAYQNTFYARLQNLSLSYNLPSNWIKKNNLKSLQLNIQAQNLFLITDYKGYDPETLSVGVAPLKTIVLGIDISL